MDTLTRFSHLNLQLVEPAMPLRPYIRHYWFISTGPAVSHTEYLPIDPGSGMVLNIGSPLQLGTTQARTATNARCVITGPHTESLSVVSEPYTDTVGLRFRPGMAYPFFLTPLTEFVLPTEPGAEIHQRLQLNQLADRLSSTSNILQRKACLDHWLLQQLQQTCPVNPDLSHALHWLEQKPSHPISALTDKVGLSQRQIERLFKQWVGISPKRYSRLVRLSKARLQLKSTPAKADGKVDLSDIALSTGYFDQAHFNREFKHSTGLTPGQYLKKHASAS